MTALRVSMQPGGGEGDDCLVVACVDPALGAALRDLNFQAEDEQFVRSFPAGALTVSVVDRFEASLLPMLRQAARLQEVPWRDALAATAERLDEAHVDWWLTGSAALAVRGAPLAPRDLDLVFADDDAHRVDAALADVLVEPLVPVEGWVCRWWCRAWLGARIECVGGVTAAADNPEPSDFGLVAASSLETVRWQEHSIRVPPLALQRSVSERRGLSERLRMIDALTVG